MASDRDAELTEAADDATFCARHPGTATELRCGRCGTPICPRCLVQTPVGARCQACTNVSRKPIPTLDVSPFFLLRGVGAALVSGVVVGAVWGFLAQGSVGIGLFTVLIAVTIGWAVSESVGLATNRKRSMALQATAVGGVVLAYFVRNVVGDLGILPVGDTWGYVAVVVAAFYASTRLRA